MQKKKKEIILFIIVTAHGMILKGEYLLHGIILRNIKMASTYRTS